MIRKLLFTAGMGYLARKFMGRNSGRSNGAGMNRSSMGRRRGVFGF